MPAFEAKPTVPYVQTATEQHSGPRISLDDVQAQLALGDAAASSRGELAAGESTAYTFDDGRQQEPAANRQEPGAAPPAARLEALAAEGAARGITANFDPTKVAQKMYDCFSFWGNDIPTLCSLVKDLTPEQRTSTLQEYAKISGSTIEDSLRRKISNGDQAERSQVYAALYPGDRITPATITCLGQMDAWFEDINPMIASLNGLSTADYDEIRAGFNQGSVDDGKFDLRLIGELKSADCKQMMDLLLRDDPMGRRAYDIYRAFEQRKVTADTPVESPLTLDEAQAVREKMASRFDIDVDKKLAERTTMMGQEARKIVAAMYANDPIGRAAFDVANAHFKGEAYYGPASVHGGKDLVDVITAIKPQDLPAVRETVRTRFGKSLDQEILTNNMTTSEQRKELAKVVYAADPVGRACFEIARFDRDLKSSATDRSLIEQGLAQVLVNYKGDMRELAQRLQSDHGLEVTKVVETTFTDEQTRGEALALLRREPSQAPSEKNHQQDPAKLSMLGLVKGVHARMEELQQLSDIPPNRADREKLKAQISAYLEQALDNGLSPKELGDLYFQEHHQVLHQVLAFDSGKFSQKWSAVFSGRVDSPLTYDLNDMILRRDFKGLNEKLSQMSGDRIRKAIENYDRSNPDDVGPVPASAHQNSPFFYELSTFLQPQESAFIKKLIQSKP